MKRNQKIAEQKMIREKFEHQRRIPELYPKTENQKLFIDAMKSSPLVVATAPAGCGKSLLACWWAAHEFLNHRCKKIVLMRAYQPLAGRSIGALPGGVELKLYGYYIQLIEYLQDFMGKGAVDVALRNGEIELGDLQSVRGRSYDEGTMIICDEAQNFYVSEVQALTTRIGEGSQMIFLGDGSGFQTDVRKGTNGLAYLIHIINKYKIDECSVIKFTREDIVRSGIVKSFVIAFEEEEALIK